MVWWGDLIWWFGAAVAQIWSVGRPGVLVWCGIWTWWSDFGKDLLDDLVV